MDAQEQNQVSSEVQKVKEEPVEYNFDNDEEQEHEEEDQLTVSQILLSGKTPPGSSPRKVSDNPRRGQRSKRERETVDSYSGHYKAVSRAMERAKEVQADLAPEFPSFIKIMLRSHVTKGFWLGLSSEFCKSNLPRHDATVVLEDESGVEYSTNFLADKMALSGGWKRFSSAQKLLEGDVLVFHLVRPSKFKVYVVRANDLAGDDALSLLNSDAGAEETDLAENSGTCKKKEKKHPRPDLDSSDLEVCKFAGSAADFKNFNIVVNGLTIDSKLSQHVRTKYYNLCCARKSYLHDRLLKGINSRMAEGIISETVNIVDAIRAYNISTFPDDLAIWDKTLEAFELLGMDVGFLRAWLNRLVSLSLESTERSKRYKEASVERDHVKTEMKSLELKLLEIKQDRRRLDDEMKDLEEKARRDEVLIQKAIALW